ncbi:MAG: mevalonate kinase [Euryarchaeota archaeon RBG_13_57_23]|nr:MAG: mevalonate kinase [Euryarchaeota archaeon RBG_13_57_23]
MVTCSAPGKMILFGEHAVVFGKPALALAINLRITSTVKGANQYSVNGHPMKKRHHMYISAALDEAWGGPPINIDTSSEIPSGSGLGSSAAVTVSCVGAMMAHRGGLEPEKIALKSFLVENKVQGRASPTDTSTSTHGQGIIVSPEKVDNFLWRIENGQRCWNIHHCEVPRLHFVVGYTRIHASTGPLVAGVKRLVDSSPEAVRAIDRIGEIVLEGVDAMAHSDKKRLGELMDENHTLLNSIQVGHPELDRLVEACRPFSYGAKLTGAGGGGSMIALTDNPSAVAKAIKETGSEPIIVDVGVEGVRLEDEGTTRK